MIHQLETIYDDCQAATGGGNDLLVQQRAAEALDKIERAAFYFVGTVDLGTVLLIVMMAMGGLANGIIFMGVIGAALLFVAYSLYADVDATGAKVTTLAPYILLFVALLIALGFEFVNGFHDTANAVATVI